MSETKNNTPPENIPVATSRRFSGGLNPSLHGTRMDYTPRLSLIPLTTVRSEEVGFQGIRRVGQKGNKRQLFEAY